MTTTPASASTPAAGLSGGASSGAMAEASARPGVVGPPDAASELRSFLTGLLRVQCGLVGAVAGAVFLLGGGGRAGGIFAKFEAPGARPVNLEGAGGRP